MPEGRRVRLKERRGIKIGVNMKENLSKHPPTPKCPGPDPSIPSKNKHKGKYVDVVAHTCASKGTRTVRSQVHVLVLFLETDAAMAGRMPILRLARAATPTIGTTATAVESWAQLEVGLRAH